MLDWLKTILGDGYSEEIDKKVSEEIGKGFVARSDYNNLNAEKKNLADTVAERDRQLETLKASTGDIEALKAQIATLQSDNAAAKEAHEAELGRVRLDGAVEAALTASGAKNNVAVKALLADFLKDAKLDDKGAVKGLSAELEAMAKAESTAFLFNSGKMQFKGMQPGTAGGKTPPPEGKEPKDMSYDELCAYLEANPDAKLE